MSKTLNIIDSLNVGMCDEAGHIFNKDMTEVGILFKVEDESALFDEVHVEAGKRNNTNNFISETQTQLEKRNPEISFYHFRYEDSQDLTPDKYNNSFSEEIATLVSKSNALKNPFVSDYYIFIKMDFSKELSEQCFEELNMLTSRVEVAFPKARRLSSYEKDDVLYSEVLPFFHFLAHKCYKEYPYFDTEIIPRVIQSDIQFGTKACFVPETEESNRYETCVEFYDRDDIVEDNPLCEFVTNPAFNKISFIHRINYKLYSNKASLKLIESKDVDLQAVDSDSIKSYSELYTLKQLLQENSIVLGNMTSGLYIHGNSEEELTEKVSKIQQILSSAGFRNKQAYQVMVFGTLISMYQYKFPFSERKAIKELDYLPSDVFSALFFFNGNYRGRAINNPWYKSVVKFQTTTESIYDFNFHKQMNKNDWGNNTPGHTFILGSTGSGKTVTLNYILNNCTKFFDTSTFKPIKSEYELNTKASMIFFDKDFGAKLNILAMGGKYLSIKTDTPTGINPLDIQFADLFDIFEKDGFKTAEVKQSVLKDLTELFCLMIKSVDDNIKIDPKTKEILTSTIKGTLKTASSLTAESYKENIKAPITTIIKHIPTSDVFSTDCLIALKKWTKGEMYGWIFDEHEGVEPLRIDCNETPILGIDGTEYLSNDSISPVINYYLLSRINKYIDGRRIILVFDECWQWIKNPTVCTFIQDKLKTMRKVNGIGVFATQSVEDLLNSNVGTTFIEQCDTKVLLSNTNAKWESYSKIGLSGTEFLQYQTIESYKKQALIKRADSVVIVKLDLGLYGLKPYHIDILGYDENNVRIIEKLIEKGYKTYKEWIPEYCKQKGYTYIPA